MLARAVARTRVTEHRYALQEVKFAGLQLNVVIEDTDRARRALSYSAGCAASCPLAPVVVLDSISGSPVLNHPRACVIRTITRNG